MSIQNQIARLLVELVEEQNMGCIFIGHDLALVRSVTQRIAVMYLGRIVELLDSENLEQKCCHPYTKALLNSIFDVLLQSGSGDPLIGRRSAKPAPGSGRMCIRIQMPQMPGEMLSSVPELKRVEEGHLAACFYPEN